MTTTRLTPHGVPGQPYGDFSGKALATNGPHNPGTITQLSPTLAVPGMRYGSFAGKAQTEAAAVSRHRGFTRNVGRLLKAG